MEHSQLGNRGQMGLDCAWVVWFDGVPALTPSSTTAPARSVTSRLERPSERYMDAQKAGILPSSLQSRRMRLNEADCRNHVMGIQLRQRGIIV